MRCGDRSVAFDKQHQNTHSSGVWKQRRDRKLFAKHTKPKQKGNRDVEQLSHVDHVSTNTHILLEASLSCTSLKTVRQWSKWPSRAEVQQWDTCREPTELRLIGCLTELTWTQRSKSKMLTPRTTCWHVNQRQLHTWWVEQKAECHVKERARRYFQGSFGDGEAETYEFDDGEDETNEFGVAHKAEQGGVFIWHLETDARRAKIQPCTCLLKRGNWKTVKMQTPESRRGEAICRSRLVSGNRSEVWRHTWTGQRWSFTTCKSQSINTWERSSTFCRRSWEITENSPIFGIETTKTNVSTWGFFIPSTVEAAIHLGPRYTDNLEVYKNTNFEEIQNLFGIVQK